MLKTLKKQKILKLLILFVFFFVLIAAFYQPVGAQCPPNVVPNPLDPNCTAGTITMGDLVNRVLGFVPFIVAVLAAGAFLYGAVRVALGGEEGREEGIKWMINAGIGVAVVGMLGFILFFLSIFTGVDLLSALGL